MLVCDGEGMAWELRFLISNNAGRVGVYDIIKIGHTHLILSSSPREWTVRLAVAQPCLNANEHVGPSLLPGTNGKSDLFGPSSGTSCAE